MVIIQPYNDGVHSQDFTIVLTMTPGRVLGSPSSSMIKPTTTIKKSNKWYKDWLKQVDKFTAEFGKRMVPMDIVKAYADIHEGIGLGKPKKRECLALHLNGQGPYGLAHYTITYEGDN